METVIIVDDNNDIAKSLVFILENAGYQVQVFSDSAVFLKNYQPLTKACLLLDMRMPNISGISVLSEIKKMHAELPVIMMTAYGDIALAVQAMKAGAFDFIIKPFDIDQLILRVKEAFQLVSQQLQQPLAHYAKSFIGLADREKEIIKRVANGQMNKVIASEMGVSIATIDICRARILKKLNLRTWAELIKIFWRLDSAV